MGIRQKDSKNVSDAIISGIKLLEKKYSSQAVKRVCTKYFMQETQKRKLQESIRQKEKELELLKKKQ